MSLSDLNVALAVPDLTLLAPITRKQNMIIYPSLCHLKWTISDYYPCEFQIAR